MLVAVGGVVGQTAVNLASGESFVDALLDTIFAMVFVGAVVYVVERWASQSDDA